MFLKSWVEMGGFELVHHWRGIDMMIVLECAILAALLSTSVALLARFWGRTRLKTAAVIASLTFATAAYAANTALSALSASGALAGGNLIYVVQTVGVGGVKATMTQVATYINSLFSGDATVASGGAVTLATVNSNVGSFGSATAAPSFTVNAKGLITAAGSNTITPAIGSITGLGAGCATFLATPSSANLAACLTDETGTGANVFANGPTLIAPALGTPASGTLTNTTGFPVANLAGAGTGVLAAIAATLNSSAGLVGALTPTNNNCVVGNGSAWTSAVCPGGGGTGANPTATASDVAVNGVATTFMRSDAAPAIQKATTSQFGLAKADGVGIGATAGVLSNLGVTSVASACGVASSGSGSVTVRGSAALRNSTGTTDTITSADCGIIVTESNASAVAVAITTAGFSTNDYVTLKNLGVGTATYTPSSGTIGGSSTLALTTGQSTDIVFNGTNWITLPGTGGGGGVTTTGSPANGNLTKFSGSTSITNGDLAGDCVTAGTLTANCNQPHPGYISGAWSTSPNIGTVASGSALPANNIVCVYEPIPKVLTVTALGAGIGTAGTSNVQFAIYANANGRPSTLIGRTNNIANNVSANTKVEGVLAANKNIGPGGTDGGRDIWFCTNQNDSTATYATIATSNSVGGAYIQSTNLIDVINGIGNGLPSGLLCAGANCNGGSSTFGTWPSTLAGSTWTIVSPGSTGNIAPVVYYKAQ